MADPEIKISFKSDSTAVDKDLERIEQKIEKLPKRIPLGQGTWTPGSMNPPKNPQQEEYGAGYKAMQEELAELSEWYSVLEEQSEKLTKSYKEELAALDENASGYAKQKKELEALIAQGEAYERTIAAQKVAVEKLSISSQQLNEKAKDIGYDKALQQQNKMGLSLGVMRKSLEQTEQKLSNYAETWVNKTAIAAEKAKNAEEKYQAVLETTGMTYEELTQLYSQLLAERARAQTPEQIQAIDRKLTAVRKNITLMGRESQLSGAKMIGAQTSVLGVMNQVVAQWRNGTLTLKGLTMGIKLFAKSTLVLAALQFAWEGISWAMEKAKTAFFGTADAEEKAAENAKKLADAAKTASDNLREANIALKGWESDKLRAEQAQIYAEAVAAQNREYEKQLKLINDATAAELHRVAMMSSGKEKEIAVEKLRLQREREQGIISEFDYEEKLIALDSKLVEIRGNAEMKQAQIKSDEAAKRTAEAQRYLDSVGKEETGFEAFTMAPSELAAAVAQYVRDEAKIKQYEDKYKEREELETELQKIKQKYKELIDAGKYFEAKHLGDVIGKTEQRMQELNDILLEVDGLIDRSTTSKANMPEAIRSALDSDDDNTIKFALEEYSKNYTAAESRHKDKIKREDEAMRLYEKALEEQDKASESLIQTADKVRAASEHQGKIAEEMIVTTRMRRDEAKADKENEKKIKRAKEMVTKMEFSYLEKQMKEMNNRSSLVGENTHEGRRRRALADVYNVEYQNRVERARDASNRVVQQGLHATGRSADIVKNLGQIALQSTQNQRVDLKPIIDAFKQALNTSRKEDDAAGVELYNLIQRLMSAQQKVSKDARKLKIMYQALARSLNDPSR